MELLIMAPLFVLAFFGRGYLKVLGSASLMVFYAWYALHTGNGWWLLMTLFWGWAAQTDYDLLVLRRAIEKAEADS